MSDLIRDAPFGQIVRWATKNKYFQYPEEKDPSLWQKYVDTEKSKNMAQFGQPNPPEESEQDDDKSSQADSQSRDRSQSNSSRTLADNDRADQQANNTDPEKGKDLTVVSWFSDDDPMNPQNWSQKKKHFVAFEICLLTTGIYIGSSIYSAGEQFIEEIFGVSAVAATLGLTCFVAVRNLHTPLSRKRKTTLSVFASCSRRHSLMFAPRHVIS